MAETAFHVEVVSVEERLWSGEATRLVAQTTDGELGILARHQPMVGQLIQGGAVAITTQDGERLAAAVRGGIISVTGEVVTILADDAQWADDLDESTVRQALEGAEKGTREHEVARGQLRALEYRTNT